MAGGADQNDSTSLSRLIRLRRSDTCTGCGSPLDRGQRAWWDTDTKSVVCTTCRPADAASEPAPYPEAPLDVGTPGGSADQRFESLRNRRAEQIDRRWGRLAGVVKFLSDDPRSITVWAQGSKGERVLAEHLSSTLGDRAVLLHDRRVPKSRSNIDHIVVASSGVWVIDTKNWSGLVEHRDVGGWFKVDHRLYVGGRDRTKAVDSMSWQIAAVRSALDAAGSDVPLHAALCFVDAEWRWFAKPFELKGVRVSGPKRLATAIGAEGPLGPAEVMDVARTLAEALPSKAV